ncbi:MAG: hypothetical protein P9M15_05955, partial [Candidatus Electryoneaceae bacterium]|nr:hypothetical protein [Candidatus Electryoneaceae bacterium]
NNHGQAEIEYNYFLDNYSDRCIGTDDEGLVISARFELANMGRSLEEILPHLGSAGADTVVNTTETE